MVVEAKTKKPALACARSALDLLLERHLPLLDGILMHRFRGIMKSDDTETVRLLNVSGRHVRYALALLGRNGVEDAERSNILAYLSCSRVAARRLDVVDLAIDYLSSGDHEVRASALALLSHATLGPYAAEASRAMAGALMSDTVVLRNEAALEFKTAGELGGDFTSAFDAISDALSRGLPALGTCKDGLSAGEGGRARDDVHYFLVWALAEAAGHGYDVSFLKEHAPRLLSSGDVNIRKYVRIALPENADGPTVS
ncbi:MAG: hypothetical protein ACP5NX_01475 [Candidatus Bilamarchaeaceae archaeon]